jgi:hypothetical protein
MSNLSKVINSFTLRDTLNPKVWDNYEDINSAILKPDIRERLLEISKEFLDFVKVDVVLSDIYLMGSLVNYNWSEYSDFDLHLIADFNQFPDNQIELYEELFDLKKTLFNLKHDIKIKGFDVELYLQDENSEAFSDGVYSVMTNEFISKPKKGSANINKPLIKRKAEQWMEIVDECIADAENEDLENSQEILKKCYKKIKRYRQSGLEKGGEFSIGNLVFKYLRRNGYIQKLLEMRDKLMDKKLSIENRDI